jgi:serine/threonine protein kinase
VSGYGFIGQYELIGQLGRGAMARVWRAYDPKLEREVAIKEPLFDERLSDDVLVELAERFVKEGKAAARLNHPGIVTIFAADVYSSRPAIVMELIDGITLGDMLQSGAINPETALEILDQLLDAAGYAHSQGIVHRDIKPDNIFITADGRVKLADFGIAHIEDSSLTKKTQVGAVLGTPGYMAPEQATGAAIDNRTDLFAIGTIAYEMFRGVNPFGAGNTSDSTTLLYRIVHEPAPELPEFVNTGLPIDVRPAILAALNKNPFDRPQDAAAFKAMLHGAPVPQAGAKSVTNSRIPPTYTYAAVPKQKQQKNLMPYGIVAAIGVVVISVLFIIATSSGGGGVGSSNSNSVAAGSTQTPNQVSSGELTSPEDKLETPPAEPAPPKIVNIRADHAIASSSNPTEFENGVSFDYSPTNTLNSDVASKWTDGVQGNGVGEWIEYRFDKEVTLVGMNIKNGNWRRYELMVNNCRFRETVFSFDDGSSQTITLADPSVGNFMDQNAAEGEKITFDTPHKTKSVTMKCQSVYQGSMYDDLVLTEVQFIIAE